MRPAASAMIALVITAPLAACSTSPISAIGAITGANSISDTDRVFLQAAGSWDRNRDSVVTCDEWKAYAAELFTGADANGDGMLDPAEWSKLAAVDRMFDIADLRYYDTNGDGKVSRAEMVDRRNQAFVLLDKTNTCTLSSSQVAGARSATQYDVSGKAPVNGDPRDASGEAGKAANGGLKR